MKRVEYTDPKTGEYSFLLGEFGRYTSEDGNTVLLDVIKDLGKVMDHSGELIKTFAISDMRWNTPIPFL